MTTYADALAIIQKKRPRDWCLYGETIERNLKRKMMPKFTHNYVMSDFDCPPLDLSKAVLLHGPTNMGKTEYALAHFKHPLLVSHMDTLRNISPEVDGIVFDDMSFKHMPVESVIHLLDLAQDRSIHCRYGTGVIPKGMPRIFTHNTANPFFDHITTQMCQQEAIGRRLCIHEVNKPTY